MIFEAVNLWLLNRVLKVTTKAGFRVRNAIAFACFLSISLVFSLSPRSVKDGTRMEVISLLVLILTVMLAGKDVKPVRWSILPAFTIELFALSIIIIRPIHPVGEGYLIFAFDILLLFPMLYIATQNRAVQKAYLDMLTSAIITSGIICFVYSTILALGEGKYVYYGRVAGATGNPNYYGMVGLALVMASLYGIARRHRSIMWEIVAAISIGIGISMMLASVSRAAMLSALACFFAFLLYVIRTMTNSSNDSTESDPTRRKRMLKYCVAALLMIISAVGALTLHQRVYFSGQDADESAFSIPLAAEVYADDKESDQEKDTQASLSDRLTTDTDLDEFSSGRIGIWQLYIEYFNLTGNDYDAENKTGSFAQMSESRAHNNFIDYAYRFGLPAGLLYAVFLITIAFKTVGIMFRGKRFTSCDLWVVMSFAAYSVYAMVEISTLPFTRYIPCIFFLSAAPLLTKKEERQANG